MIQLFLLEILFFSLASHPPRLEHVALCSGDTTRKLITLRGFFFCCFALSFCGRRRLKQFSHILTRKWITSNIINYTIFFCLTAYFFIFHIITYTSFRTIVNCNLCAGWTFSVVSSCVVSIQRSRLAREKAHDGDREGVKKNNRHKKLNWNWMRKHK